VTGLPAGHAFVTEDTGESCERSEAPYVVDCDYDQAGDLLSHIYGALKPRSVHESGRYVTFSQREFRDSPASDGLAGEGVVYVPKACEAETCRVHIAFHGCAQNRDSVGDTFIRGSGFARWADTNKLIVLYPQTAMIPFNPQGCWDWWGYTGHDYLTRNAPQIVAVKRMLDRLAEGAGGH
jgi:poly(3-hydroxybutyrate) depolymerase